VRIPVVGNGDVKSHDDARAMTSSTGCAAVMIGRAALGSPWIFAGAEVPKDERARIIRRHVELIETLLPERLALIQVAKHLAWYSAGRPGAARMRPALWEARDTREALATFWSVW
jgi:tRNA-dihydrouridine synthase